MSLITHNDVTILIQGRLHEDCVQFYVNNYTDYNVVISTWDSEDISEEALPANFTLLKTSKPEIPLYQNVTLQLISTLYGLRAVTTPYVIKMRGDEYYSNIAFITQTIEKQKNKIICSPVFFRPWSYDKFHISDHLIAGSTEDLLTMFSIANEYVESPDIDRKESPEILLTCAYLIGKYGKNYRNLFTDIELMHNFYILNLENTKPYRITANCFSKVWLSDFIKEQNSAQYPQDKPPWGFSVFSIEEIFL